MKTTEHIRLNTFCSQVAISTEATDTLYLNADDALALATELRRFAKGCKMTPIKWFATRIIRGGIARNETDNKRKPYLVP